MRLQPNRDYESDDVVMTPRPLARALVDILAPKGRILEPCSGDGAFLEALPPGTEWCEITRGRNFFDWSERVDWIITNPPWRQIRPFLNHAFAHAENVGFLMTINHAWTRARLRDACKMGFSITDLILFDTPSSFPQSGFQTGMVVYRHDASGTIRVVELPGAW